MHTIKTPSTLRKAFFILGIFIFAACGNHLNYEGKSIFRYNESAGISSLDPAFAKEQANIWAVHQIFNGLVQMDKNLEVKPCIAQSWQISDNGLNYIFTLRRDVYFHENECFENKTRTVNAHDFEYSFKRLISPQTAAPGSWVFQKVKNFKAANDSTFVIELKEPFTPFLGLLTMKYCSVVPREAIDFYGNNFSRNPVGTGPFYMKLWAENEKLVLLKNPNYFETDNGVPLPYLDAVAISFIPDKQSAFLEFSKGKMDFLSGLDAGYKDELLKADGTLQDKFKERITMQTQPYLNTEYLGLNMHSKHPALQNKYFRQALNYGINRKDMVKYLRNNIGTPALAGMVPNGLPGFTSTASYGYFFDTEKAKELLKKSQLQLNNLPPLELVTTSNYRDLCEYAQGEWKKIGINVNVNVVPAAHLRELKAKGEADFFRASWIADYPDPENYLSMFYTQNFTPNGPNYTFFSDSLFDAKYSVVRKEVDEDLRIQTSQQADSIVMENAPVVPLFYDQVIRFYHNNIKNLEGNALNLLELKKVQKL